MDTESRFHQHCFLDGELIVYGFSSLRYCVAVVGGNVSSGMLVALTRKAHLFYTKFVFNKTLLTSKNQSRTSFETTTGLKVYKCLYSMLLQATCWLFYTIVTG